MSDPILVDAYEGDGDVQFSRLLAATDARYCGAMLKVSQGLHYNGDHWLSRKWPEVRAVAGDRYGVDWFRQGYHYLDVSFDGVAQADYFYQQIEKVGGFGHGDLYPVVDVERGGQRGDPSRARVIDCAAKFVQRVRDLAGVTPICYGGNFLRELGIHVRDFGCELGWVADYNATLPAKQYESIGVDLEHLFAWQYAGVNGDGSVSVHLAGYPWTTPAGKLDLSAVLIAGGGDGAMSWMRSTTVQAA